MNGKKLKPNDFVKRGCSYTLRPVIVQKQLQEGMFMLRCYWHGSIGQLAEAFWFQFELKFEKKLDLKSFQLLKISRCKQKDRIFNIYFKIDCEVAKLCLCNDFVSINNMRAFIREA